MNRNTPAPPQPQPLCAAFAHLLPLLNAGELDSEQAASVRDHLATCAWCRAQLAGYDVIESAARRHYAGTPAAIPLFHLKEMEKLIDEPTVPQYEPISVRPTLSSPTPPRRRLPALNAIAAALLVALLAGLFFSRHTGQYPGAQKTFQHDGGLRITFSMSCLASQPGCDIKRLSAQTRDILQQRAIAGLGAADAVVRLDGNATIVVELPGFTSDKLALDVLARTGELDFIGTGGMPLRITTDVSTQLCTVTCAPGQYRILFTSVQLDPNSLSADFDPQSKRYAVTFAFAQPYRQQFAEYTRQHIGQYLTIALDGIVIESATIQSEIAGTGQITGLSSMDNAQMLVVMLKYHALPLFLKVSKEEYVSPVPTSIPVSEWRNMAGAYVSPVSSSTP